MSAGRVREPPFWRRPIATPEWWAEHSRAWLGFALLVAVLFPGAILRGQTFFLRDIHLQWHGQMESFVRSVGAGSLPVWDPWIGFGQPLWANANNQLLYPTTWLNLLLPATTVFTVFVAVHALLGAAGLYLWARQLGVSRAGAWVAAALWTASGPMLSCVNLWNHYSGAAWMPWALMAADRTLATGRPASALAWGAAMAAQILCGSPDTFVMTSLLGAARVASSLSDGSGPSRPRRIGLAALAWALALGLAAAQWVPALEAARASARWHLPLSVRAAWSLPPAGLLQTVVPIAWDDSSLGPAQRAALFGAREPLLLSLYLGLPVAALVVAAALGRRRQVAFFAVATLAAGVMALGSHTQIYGIVTTLLPPLAMIRFPAKAMLVVALGWAILAGFGFDAWRGAGQQGAARWRSAAAVAPMAALVVVSAAAALLLGGGGASVVTRGGVARSVLLGAAAALLSLRPGTRTGILVAAMSLADLLLAGRGLNPTAPPELLAAPPPVLAAIRQEDRRRLYVYDYLAAPGLARRHLGRDDPYVMRLGANAPPWMEALGMRAYLTPPVAEVWGVFQSYDMDAMGLLPTPQVGLNDLLLRSEGSPLHLRLLALGAVSEMVALHADGLESLPVAATFPGLFPEPIRVFRVPDPLPRTYAVAGVRVADGPDALGVLADPTFDARREVVLSEGTDVPPARTFAGTSRVVSFRPDRVLLEADLAEAGYVVLVDAYGPGWGATVDGRPVPLLRANVAFRAVRVPAGRHQIELVDRPSSVIAGLSASLLTLLALLGWLLAHRPVRPRLDSIPGPR